MNPSRFDGIKELLRVAGIDGRNGLVADDAIEFEVAVKETVQDFLNTAASPIAAVDTPVKDDFLQSLVVNGFDAVFMVKSMSIKLLDQKG